VVEEDDGSQVLLFELYSPLNQSWSRSEEWKHSGCYTVGPRILEVRTVTSFLGMSYWISIRKRKLFQISKKIVSWLLSTFYSRFYFLRICLFKTGLMMHSSRKNKFDFSSNTEIILYNNKEPNIKVTSKLMYLVLLIFFIDTRLWIFFCLRKKQIPSNCSLYNLSHISHTKIWRICCFFIKSIDETLNIG